MGVLLFRANLCQELTLLAHKYYCCLVPWVIEHSSINLSISGTWELVFYSLEPVVSRYCVSSCLLIYLSYYIYENILRKIRNPILALHKYLYVNKNPFWFSLYLCKLNTWDKFNEMTLFALLGVIMRHCCWSLDWNLGTIHETLMKCLQICREILDLNMANLILIK